MLLPDSLSRGGSLVRQAVVDSFTVVNGTHSNSISAQALIELSRLHVFDVVLAAMAKERGLPEPAPLTADSAHIAEEVAGITRTLLRTLGQEVRGTSVDPIPADVLSIAYEMTYGLSSDSVDESGVTSTSRKRDDGVFFTPPDLARSVSDVAVGDLAINRATSLLDCSIVDPAAGAGSFLLAALRSLYGALARGLVTGPQSIRLRRQIASSCLYAVDKDDTAMEIAKRLIWLEVGDADWDGLELETNFRCADSLTSSLADWREWFPQVFENDGFDLVLGNPPWGAVKARRKEFLEHLDDRVRETYGSELRTWLDNARSSRELAMSTLWSEYEREISAYAAGLRSSEEFRYQGTSGDRDLYKYFMERSIQITRPFGGRVSLVVPGAFLRAKGAGALRERFLSLGTFTYVTEFINKKRIFPIHSMFRFTVFGYRRGPSGGIRCLTFGATQVDQLASGGQPEGCASLSLSSLRRLGGKYLLVPEIKSRAERKLLEKLLSAHPPLGDTSVDSWNVRFRREVDMTNDSDDFMHVDRARSLGWNETPSGYWSDGKGMLYRPVIEGRMVQQFDATAKAYVEGVGRRASWRPQPVEDPRTRPQFLFPAHLAMQRGIQANDRAGFRDITGHANRRTVISAVIPGSSVAGNKVPTCEFDSSDEGLPHLWVALANSFVIDWIARRYVSTTLNFFYLQLVPFPRIPTGSQEARELVRLARKLADPFRAKTLNRSGTRARIDAIVADLFDLTPNEFSLILDDFPSLDRKQPGSNTITRDYAMLGFYQLRRDDTDGSVVDLRNRVARESEIGAAAYS